MLALSASAGEEGPTSTVRVGLSEDERSVVAPPGQFEAVSLRIKASEEAGKRAGLLMAERRVATGDGETFRLRLGSEADGPVELTAGSLDAIESREARLLVPTAGETHDLRREEAVTIEPDGETAELKLAVGTESYVEKEASEVIPEEVALTSYPNPVRKQGTLEYALPEETEVTLRVYDVLGRQVATLEQGRKEAGRHTVRLETGRLSSGVYFGRLQTDDQTRTQKITVVR
ncbi:MAG: hypothetical protein BRD30_00375 [Bacteroidetes bacterium QH_2_63_10]|nr:MAG: hypothetical protein BRD30_00375 [Bacteroidetes bacterium QH_2_63_10]